MMDGVLLPDGNVPLRDEDLTHDVRVINRSVITIDRRVSGPGPPTILTVLKDRLIKITLVSGFSDVDAGDRTLGQ